MFTTPDYFPDVSQRLSMVLDDVGVNENVCFVRRKTNLLMERMEGLKSKICCQDSEMYYFGSQTEGSTTAGMESDKDKLVCTKLVNVAQDQTKYVQGKHNMLMVEDNRTPPGYCYIKLSEPVPQRLKDQSVCDDRGNYFLQNTFLHDIPIDKEVGSVRQGPAQTIEEFNMDHVMAFPSQSWPKSAKPWAYHDSHAECPSDHIRKQSQKTGCFLVPTGNSLSENEKYEWRISTSRAERCFIFNMSTTQIKCYTMLKIIMKGIIKPLVGEALTSFQCKSMLMYVVERTYNQPWTEDRLLGYVVSCLRVLRNCVLSNNCPHYFIPENNLLGGRIDKNSRRQIEQELNSIINDGCRGFLCVKIDDFGERLALKFGTILEVNLTSGSCSPGNARATQMSIIGQLFCRLFASKLMFVYLIILQSIQDSQEVLPTLVENLLALSFFGNESANDAAHVMRPVLSVTVASMIASLDISKGHRPSDEALEFFDIGIKSDVAAGRLKLASVFYCAGDMNKAEQILADVEKCYDRETVLTVCNCRSTEPLNSEYEIPEVVKDPEADCYGKVYFASGVLFTRYESFCVPKPLQYEMYRCTGQELDERGQIMFFWNDWAVVDALPYLYFLQYLTFKQLGRDSDKEHALDKLAQVIDLEPQLFHRETAMNLLGQCMELENHIHFAFVCYRWSLLEKPTHNAARWLMCALIGKMYRTSGMTMM